MDADREDEGTIALAVQYFLTTNAPLSGNGWEVTALDIGEVDIITPNGQHFRMTVEEIEEEDQWPTYH